MTTFANSLAIYCADVGSVPLGRFAWAAGGLATDSTPDNCSSIDALTIALCDDLRANRPVALGFESPLSVPVQEQSIHLGKARDGEGNRPWSSGGGVAALGTGMAQLAYLLKAIADDLELRPAVFLEWKDFHSHGSGLFIWEAFITKKSKAQPTGDPAFNPHVEDARIGVKSFMTMGEWPATAVHSERPFSIAGAALLWSELTDDVDLLNHEPLVVKV